MFLEFIGEGQNAEAWNIVGDGVFYAYENREESQMFNYRRSVLSEQELLDHIAEFCKGKHDADEIIQHCMRSCDDLFALHEYTFFLEPRKLDNSTWEIILWYYVACMTANNISFPERPAVGPVYNRDRFSGKWVNPDKKLAKNIGYQCHPQEKS